MTDRGAEGSFESEPPLPDFDYEAPEPENPAAQRYDESNEPMNGVDRTGEAPSQPTELPIGSENREASREVEQGESEPIPRDSGVDAQSSDASQLDQQADTVGPLDYTIGPHDAARPKIDARTALHHEQGQNEFGYRGTCGLASMADMITDQTGDRLTEDELVKHAADKGLCATADQYSNPDVQGATSFADRDEVLKDVLREDDAFTSEVLKDQALGDLANRVENGDGVLASVKAGEYWPDASRDVARSELGTDHVVWVTGVERDAAGEVNGFVVNDTGLVDGAGLRMSDEQMSRAWQQRGGILNVVRRTR